jgi:hypothetical protein
MTFANFNKKLEMAANITIIAVAALLGVVLVKNHLMGQATTKARAEVPQAQQASDRIPVGTNLTSLDVDWKQSPQTLVLAISTACHFCTDSASFYKTLVQKKSGTRIIAVFPQPVDEGRGYLQKLGVPVDEVRQLPLDKIGVRGTPTLLLVDTSGSIKDSWVGKLPAEKETDVVSHLQL